MPQQSATGGGGGGGVYADVLIHLHRWLWPAPPLPTASAGPDASASTSAAASATTNALLWTCGAFALLHWAFARGLGAVLRRARYQRASRAALVRCAWSLVFHAAATLALAGYYMLVLGPAAEGGGGGGQQKPQGHRMIGGGAGAGDESMFVTMKGSTTIAGFKC